MNTSAITPSGGASATVAMNGPVSADHASSTSSSHAHSSVPLSAPGRREDIAPNEIAIGVIIGRASEYFDFFVYAIASVLVFPKLIFPWADPLTGTLYSFAVFALAFLVRPVGSLLFTAIDRRYGRGAKLAIALVLLGTSTAALAFLPGYAEIGGQALALLILCRIGQGLGMGGSWDGLASLLALNAPESRRGWYAMMPQLGAPIGLIVASLLFVHALSSLTPEEFFAWGWRYPFLAAFSVNVVGLFARLRIVMTPDYERLFRTRDLQPSPVGETVREAWHTIIIGAFAPLASFALFHMVTVFPLSWVTLSNPGSALSFLTIEMLSACCGLVAIVLSGKIADQVGRRTLLALCALGIAGFAVAAPLLLESGPAGQVLYMLTGFILLGLSFGQSSGVVAASFPTPYRYTGSALTSDLAWLFGAGFAPFVALFLTANFGLSASGGYLLSGAVATLLALGLNKGLALAR